MLNVQVEKVNGILVTTSNRVAEELGVLHKDLLEKIDNYINKFQSAELSADFYIPSKFKDNRNRTYRNYLITKKGIAQLIGGYSAAVERAFELNVAYINKFEEMEKELSLGKQISFKVPISYENMVVNTFNGIPVMELKQFYQLINRTENTVIWHAKCLGATVLKSEELVRYKIENGESKRRIGNLMILYKEQIISLCKKFGIYEEMKDVIENYFKLDNRLEYKKEDLNDKYWNGIYETMKEAQELENKIEKIFKEELNPLYDRIISLVGAKKTMLGAFNCMKYGNIEGIRK